MSENIFYPFVEMIDWQKHHYKPIWQMLANYKSLCRLAILYAFLLQDFRTCDKIIEQNLLLPIQVTCIKAIPVFERAVFFFLPEERFLKLEFLIVLLSQNPTQELISRPHDFSLLPLRQWSANSVMPVIVLFPCASPICLIICFLFFKMVCPLWWATPCWCWK